MIRSHVSITAAFGAAWERMKTILFRPFDLGKWFVLGFTAWLAGLAGSGGSGGGSSNWGFNGSSDGPGDLDISGGGAESVLREVWEKTSQWLLDNPLWATLGLLGCGLLVAFVVVVLWVSSRGKFMFLDNVVHNRAEVAAPWKRYRQLANSHFFFQLGFAFLVLALVTGLVLVGLALAAAGSLSELGGPISIVLIAAGILLFLLFGLTLLYIQYFLDGFVVPLMHRHNLRVMAAWSRFGEIFRQHAAVLLLSGLFVFVLAMAAAVAIFVSGLMTCCIGFLFLIIPYIGTVLVLPVPVTFRAFTVALLDQIDPGYFPQETTPPYDRPSGALPR